MPDGFRILENGDYRITEADVFRITERFDEGFSDLNGSGSLAVIGSLKQLAFFDISSEGIFSATPILKGAGLTSLTGSGSITITAIQTQVAASNLNATGSIDEAGAVGSFAYMSVSATGSLAATGFNKLNGLADLQLIGTHLFAGDRRIGHSHNFEASGVVSADATVKAYRSSDLTSSSSVDVSGQRIKYGLSALTGTGSITTTELIKFLNSFNKSGTGSISVIGNAKNKGNANLTNTSTLAAIGTEIDFTSTLYVKDTTWKVATPYVKHNGSWKVPDIIYNKVNGTWTRVY